MFFKIKELADIVGISVRTLHYYDKINLLKPNAIKDNGYRLYNESDLERLQQILFFKELDFTLQEIKEILDNPNFNREEALNIHKKLLTEKVNRLQKIINNVDKTLKEMRGEIKMSNKEKFDGFDMSEIDKYKEEVKRKYKDTDAYKENEEKTSKYTKDDWNRINEGMNAIFKKLAGLMDKSPEDKEVQVVVEEWRNYITKNFYNCTIDIFRGLGQMYVADERFKNNIDKINSGLAEFLSEAIKSYCDK
ncbi:MAG: MerR family transcriptional regulator [Clostridium sp.]|nr:MerR family transcriptional regulator [Clostridium sp.]